jgi:hypothetical protein
MFSLSATLLWICGENSFFDGFSGVEFFEKNLEDLL